MAKRRRAEKYDGLGIKSTIALLESQVDVPLLLIGWTTYKALVQELGQEGVQRLVVRLLTLRQKPIGVFVQPRQETMWLSPPEWTQERLAGGVAVHHEALETAVQYAAQRPQGGYIAGVK